MEVSKKDQDSIDVISLREGPYLNKVVRILINDDQLLQEYLRFARQLKTPNNIIRKLRRVHSQSCNYDEIFNDIISSWVSRNTDVVATLTNMIKILEKLNFNNVAEKLQQKYDEWKTTRQHSFPPQLDENENKDRNVDGLDKRFSQASTKIHANKASSGPSSASQSDDILNDQGGGESFELKIAIEPEPPTESDSEERPLKDNNDSNTVNTSGNEQHSNVPIICLRTKKCLLYSSPAILLVFILLIVYVHQIFRKLPVKDDNNNFTVIGNITEKLIPPTTNEPTSLADANYTITKESTVITTTLTTTKFSAPIEHEIKKTVNWNETSWNLCESINYDLLIDACLPLNQSFPKVSCPLHVKSLTFSVYPDFHFLNQILSTFGSVKSLSLYGSDFCQSFQSLNDLKEDTAINNSLKSIHFDQLRGCQLMYKYFFNMINASNVIELNFNCVSFQESELVIIESVIQELPQLNSVVCKDDNLCTSFNIAVKPTVTITAEHMNCSDY